MPSPKLVPLVLADGQRDALEALVRKWRVRFVSDRMKGSMAGETGPSQSSVSRIWRAFGLKPHLVETWKLSMDPEFIAKVRDAVGTAAGSSSGS